MSSETREILHDQDDHPIHGTRTYWIIGFVLVAITVLEILAYVVEDSLGAGAAPIILILSAAKFILVVMFYMHLKYDSNVFSGIFLFPLALASLVIIGLTILYKVLHPLEI